MRILITRPKEDASATAEILRARGHAPVVAPLLDIRYRQGIAIPLETRAILATSAKGVRALARNTPRRDMLVFAVGAQTAQAARVAGFADVQSADGDARDLAKLIMRTATKQDVLLHAAGSETRGDLVHVLRQEGFDARSVTLYDAIAATQFPSDVNLASLDAALFYSPRSAAIFVDIANGASCERTVACCISTATADALISLRFREIRVAARPHQDSLLSLLG